MSTGNCADLNLTTFVCASSPVYKIHPTQKLHETHEGKNIIIQIKHCTQLNQRQRKQLSFMRTKSEVK